MKEKIQEIRKACPHCSYGMGLHKQTKDGLIHLDLFATKEAGAIYKCEAENLLQPYIIKMDGNENPEFDPEFLAEYTAIKAIYGEDMTKDNYSFQIWCTALGNYFNWDYEEDYDEEKIAGVQLVAFEPYYNDGLNLKQALDKFFK